jgi:hypothetical protein
VRKLQIFDPENGDRFELTVQGKRVLSMVRLEK